MTNNETPLEVLFELASMIIGDKSEKFVQIVDNPQHTTNLFGPIKEIAGKQLKLIERNSSGDCLCMFKGKAGENLVDVDHRDVKN